MVALKTILQALFYFIFWIIAFMFLQQTVYEYMEKRTSYSVKYEAITLQDLPTVLVCVNNDMIYSENISIDVRIFGEQSEANWTLSLGGNVVTGSSLQLELRNFWQTRFSWQNCYKISSKWNKNRYVDIMNFGIQFMIRDLNGRGRSVRIFLTSEENIYGVSWFQFYDGKFKRIEKVGAGLGRKCRVLYITGLTEYRNLKDLCSQESYYRCLARRFAAGMATNIFFGARKSLVEKSA